MSYNIVCWSGGADSTTTVILAHELGIHLDLIIFAEVMFDKDISGELPEHIEFIHKCIPIFESWGYKVKILRSDDTYMDCFFKVNSGKRNPDRKDMRYGFPMAGKCIINARLKVGTIRKFLKSIDKEFVQYVGICADEPKRLERLKGTNKVSLLAEYGITQEMARAKCKEYGLLSPTYAFANRGGVGSARMQERENLDTYGRTTEICGTSCCNSKMSQILSVICGTY